MIKDLVKIVTDRFRCISSIDVNCIVDGHYIGVYRVSMADVICHIYFNSDHVLCKVCDGSAVVATIFMSYDEFVDVDEFVGGILCKRFYYDYQ